MQLHVLIAGHALLELFFDMPLDDVVLWVRGQGSGDSLSLNV